MKTKTISDMRAKNFNKSEIFKTAWSCYRKHSDSMTFGDCLRWAWKKAWENLHKSNAGAYACAILRKEKKQWKKYDERNRQLYSRVAFGRNDWRADYGNRYARIAM